MKLKKKFLLMNVFVMAFFVNVQAQIFPNPATLSTGQGAIGANDPLWVVSPFYPSSPPGPMGLAYTPALINNNCAPGAWIDPTTLPPPVNNGNWITGSGIPCTGSAGYFYFRLTLNLPADCNGNSVATPGVFTLNLSGYVDNLISDVFVNGTSTGFSGGSFSIGTQLNMTLVGPWVPGINYVDVLVYNGGGPYGLLLVANTTANASIDSDGDGVPDINDQCPCTPGTDAVGCSPLPPPNNCNVALIRTTLIGAGNTELLNMDNTCSLYFINPQFMSGPAAQSYAQTFGANLVSIQSASENTALMNALNNQGYAGQVIWLGYGRPFFNGPFYWYDGSPVSYTDWAPGEPNNSGDEECTQIHPDGTWNDLNCNNYNSLSVIEVNLCPVTTITSTATAICIGQSTTISASTILGSSPYTYSWTSIPAGFTSTSATFTASPTVTTVYSVTETDRYGCTSQNSITITVNSITASITPNGATTFCQGGNVLLTANNSSSYNWSTTEITQSVTAAATGNYSVTITDANGCTATDQIAVTVNPAPVATFNSTNVCLGNAIQFTDNSSTSSGTINLWGWDFGDGTPLNNTPSPSHTYAAAGSYNVTLVVSNSFGCINTITKPVQVYFNPTASFTHANVCVGDTMYFTNTSFLDPSTSMSTYLWVFGDSGPTSGLLSPSHYYTNPGIYNVTLVTTTIDGCSNVANVAVSAFDAPTSAFTFSNTCLSDSARFTNTSINPTMSGMANWSWDFGDGSPVNTSFWSPAHLYAAAGNYTVTLITHSSSLGCPDTMTASITIFPMPVADFSFADVCLNKTMTFTDLSTIPSGTIATYSWNFGDASPLDNSQSPTHTYLMAGTFNVKLIITSNSGCKDTAVKSVVVHPLPVILFPLADVCDGSTVPLNDASTIPASDALQFWAWNFGDGSALNTNQNTTHLYAAPGSYNVEHYVVSFFQCIDSLTKTVVVSPNPLVLFTAPDTVGCEPLCVSFLNSSSVLTGSNVHYLWSFGDGSPTSISQGPTHCYKNDSVFLPITSNVTLTVTSDKGCISSLIKNNYIKVYPNPVAAFSVQPRTTSILEPIITFTNLSTGANFWAWNFGDSLISLNSNPPPHTYPDTGTYVVTLITSTLFNCWDTTYQNVTIDPDFVFYIPSAFSPNGDGLNETFSGKGIFIEQYEMTIFDRWGNLIYKTTDINKPWDGKATGGSLIAQNDVYVYSIVVTDTKKNKHYYKGMVTLLK